MAEKLDSLIAGLTLSDWKRVLAPDGEKIWPGLEAKREALRARACRIWRRVLRTRLPLEAWFYLASGPRSNGSSRAFFQAARAFDFLREHGLVDEDGEPTEFFLSMMLDDFVRVVADSEGKKYAIRITDGALTVSDLRTLPVPGADEEQL